MENQNICQKFISEIDVFDRVYQKTNGIVTILQGDIREVGLDENYYDIILAGAVLQLGLIQIKKDVKLKRVPRNYLPLRFCIVKY
jgi:hypothetical protein